MCVFMLFAVVDCDQRRHGQRRRFVFHIARFSSRHILTRTTLACGRLQRADAVHERLSARRRTARRRRPPVRLRMLVHVECVRSNRRAGVDRYRFRSTPISIDMFKLNVFFFRFVPQRCGNATADFARHGSSTFSLLLLNNIIFFFCLGQARDSNCGMFIFRLLNEIPFIQQISMLSVPCRSGGYDFSKMLLIFHKK
jgi:hypothetical protein